MREFNGHKGEIYSDNFLSAGSDLGPATAMFGDKVNLFTFCLNDKKCHVDIIDGKIDITGDLPVTDAAKMLFETLKGHIDAWRLVRAASRPQPDGQ